MEAFYAKLAEGWTKGAALRHAQRAFIENGDGGVHGHPFFWAPFFLVGDARTL
jgi:CHAT domain-containing protein